MEFNILEGYPRWLDQLNYVEVWLENDAMADNVKNILEGRDVVIVPNKGITSIPFLHANTERLLERFNSGREHNVQVHILYLGDLDPAMVGFNLLSLIFWL